MRPAPHQYIERESSAVKTERLFADRLLHLLYGASLENAGVLLRLLTAPWTSRLLAFLNYDLPLGLGGAHRFAWSLGVELAECVEGADQLDTARKVFERKIRYWECRPLPDDPSAVVAPADARVLIGSLAASSHLFLKGKFFDQDELLGPDKPWWRSAFQDAESAIFRLTPDRYHYNHTPVAGIVRDIYEVGGDYHSCNPGPVVAVAVPYSKNRRVVTILDSDVPDGTHVGLVAMIEVVALMIGEIVQCYSEVRYERPASVVPGMFLRRGQPKSRYRPGSSTTVLLFQRGRVAFCDDLVRNTTRPDVHSRFSRGLGQPLVETDVKVRSTIATALGGRRHGQ